MATTTMLIGRHIELMTDKIFIHYSRRRPDQMSERIMIVPIAWRDYRLMDFLVAQVSSVLGVSVIKGAMQELPRRAWVSHRRQYFAPFLLEEMAKIQRACGATVLGITGVDMFSDGLTFAYGEAVRGGRHAVVSMARLRPSFAFLKTRAVLAAERLCKEALHEIGHALGLYHCRDPLCVMRFSSNLKGVDTKGEVYCNSCLAKLCSFAQIPSPIEKPN